MILVGKAMEVEAMSYALGSDMPRIEEDLRHLRNQIVTWVVACSTIAAAAAATLVVWRTNGTDAQIDTRVVRVHEQVGKLAAQLTALQGALDEQRRAAAAATAPTVQPAARRPTR